MSHGLFAGLFAGRGTPEPVPVPSVTMGALAPAGSADALPTDRSFQYAIDALPCNVMFCDRDLILRYLNKLLAQDAAHRFSSICPCPSIRSWASPSTSFIARPPMSTGFWAPKHHGGKHHLPHKATIALGPIKLDLEMEPMLGTSIRRIHWRRCALGHQHAADN
jgi:hypothetical protein